MARTARIHLFLWVVLTLLGWGDTAQAQVYRCGNAYSDAPCKDGRAIDVSPPMSDPGGPRTAVIYLCKPSDGRLLWSAAPCGASGMALERTERVPIHLDWEQQVAVAHRLYAQAQSLVAPPPVVHRSAPPQPSRQAVCQALEERIRQLDSMGRAGSLHYDLDWVRRERKKARDEQFRLPCR